MKKYIKILIILLLFIMFFISINNIVRADDYSSEMKNLIR